ncbi:hypothetical protein OpiT1DRAFT_03003 [Opitutaceae bacterium TAV1]|nr:hypothetical protein OpiT1DRAFT_03003 [Opitutaceae bacterium TAV1]
MPLPARLRHRVALVLLASLAVCLAPAGRAAIPDAVVQVTATTSAAAPHITLEWPLPPGTGTASPKLWRRVKGAAAWESPILLPSQATGYADAAAQPGVTYEYSLEMPKGAGLPAYGGIVAGHDLPLVESRGKVLLYVDETQAGPLAPELDRLSLDLAADGWTVYRHDGPRQVYPASSTNSAHYAGRLAEREAMRAVIKGYHDIAPGDDWALFIIGRAPVAYSGNQNPDGHADHIGAWPTDLYYGDMTGVWTDTTVSSSSAADPRNRNVPGDGKFDQTNAPAPVVIQVGRLDMAGMEGVPPGFDETGLLRQYLVRNHRFRHGLAPYDAVERRALIDTGFASLNYTHAAWKTGTALFGRGAGRVDELDWFSTLQTRSVLYAYGEGGGTYTSAGGIGTSADFAAKDSRAVLMASYGSYFGDWDTPRNFLRAPLAGTPGSLGLTSLWNQSAALFHLATGETVGHGVRHLQNEMEFPASGGWAGSRRSVVRNLLGDPTLRLHTVRPPRNVTARAAAAGVALAWEPSPDAEAGYHVYRSASPACPFMRLTGRPATAGNPLGSPITGTGFTDESVVSENHYTYLVKAVRRETSASGTYANQSIGAYAALDYVEDGESPPAAPGGLTATATGTTTRVLDWLDNADDETGVTVERFDLATGAWSSVATLPADARTYTDTAAPAGLLSHYRVRAHNANGVSAWSDTAADYTRPGTAEPSGHFAASRAEGQANIPVQRLLGDLGNVALSWQTAPAPGSFAAQPGTDYTHSTGTLHWAHGDTSDKFFPFPLVNTAGPRLSTLLRVNYATPTNGLVFGSASSTWVQLYDPAAQDLRGWLTDIVTPSDEPSPWPGFAEYHDGVFGIAARTGAVASGRAADSLRFVYLPVTGDCTLTVRVSEIATQMMDGTPQTGIMLRASLAGGASMKAIYLYANRSIVSGQRLATSASLVTTSQAGHSAPRWLRLRRTGNSVTTTHSADGVSWTSLGATATISSLPATTYVGLFVASDTYEEGLPAYARFDNVTLEAALTTPANFALRPGPGPGEVSLSWSAAPGAVSYEVQRSESAEGGFVTVATLSAPSGGLADAGLTPGVNHHYRVRAIGPDGASEWSPVLSSTAYLPPTFEGWAYLHFGADAPEAVAGRLADPDGDGLPNLLEYAAGSFPLASDTGLFAPRAAIHEVDGTEYLTMSFVRDPFAYGVKLYLEASDDLRSPEWERIDPLEPANQVSVENDVPEPGLQRIVAKDTQPLAASPSRFLRLRVTEDDYPLFFTGFETGSGYRAGESVRGFADPTLPGTAAWTMHNPSSPALPLVSTANPLSGSQALRLVKPDATGSGGVTLNLAALGLADAPFVLRFGLAVHNYSAGTGNQLQVYLGNAGTDPGGGKYWTLLIFNEGVFYLYRASSTGASNQAVNLGAYTAYADHGDYVSFELAVDPVTKTYTGVRVSGAKGTADFTETLAGATLPWRPDQAGDPASVFQFILGSNDIITVDLDDLSLDPDGAAAEGEPLASTATVPEGYLKIDLAGGTPAAPSTARFALPLTGYPDNAGAREGFITALSGKSLTLADAGWSPGQLAASPHAIRLADRARAGLTLTIAANTSDTLTVAASDDLPALGVANGDRFRIIPVDTIGSLLPPGVLIGGPDAQSADIVFLGQTSQSGYYFNTSLSRWVGTTGPAIDRGGVVIPPDASIGIARTGAAISLLFTGRVPAEPFVVAVPGGGSLHTHTGFPVDTTLGGLALQTRVPGWVSAASAAQSDQVLLPSSSGWTAYYHNGLHWQLATGPALNRDTTVVGGTTPLLLLRHGFLSGSVELHLPVPYTLE